MEIGCFGRPPPLKMTETRNKCKMKIATRMILIQLNPRYDFDKQSGEIHSAANVIRIITSKVGNLRSARAQIYI